MNYMYSSCRWNTSRKRSHSRLGTSALACVPPATLPCLRPRKLAFGHGHPVTSGSPGIDYFVSSQLFETAASIDAREVRRIAGTASDISQAAAAAAARALEAASEAAHTNNDESAIIVDDDGTNHVKISSATSSDAPATTGPDGRRPGLQRDLQTTGCKGDAGTGGGSGDGRPGCRKGGGGGGCAEQDYTEQLVLFDSLTASLPEVFGPPPRAISRTAAVLAAVGESWSTTTPGSLAEGHHLYHCIQHSKKIHPDFDPVLRGILESDPAAKILLTTGSKVCSPQCNRGGYSGVFSTAVTWQILETWNSSCCRRDADAAWGQP